MKEFLYWCLFPLSVLLFGMYLGFSIKVGEQQRNILTINDCRGNHEGTIDSGIDHIEQLLK